MFCMTKDKDRACKTIAVTSANPSEGKSLTAANIAISYAMLGKKTLLIDADLRKPTQRRLWKLDVSAGLCDFIAGICRLELVKVKELPLWIVGAGTIPPNPSELLSSDRMKSFVTDISKRYDYVIIDTPPINTVADAQILSAFVNNYACFAPTFGQIHRISGTEILLCLRIWAQQGSAASWGKISAQKPPHPR